MRLAALKILVGAILLTACKPTIGTTTTDPTALCAHLNSIGCPQSPNCAAAVGNLPKTLNLNEACLMGAKSPQDVTTCNNQNAVVKVRCGAVPDAGSHGG